MKVLYIEDNPQDRELTRIELRRHAPEILLDTAATQREALLALATKPDYDLVLTDVVLPDGDGLALLTRIRGRGLPIAVVVITGQGDEEMAVTALKAGAQDYVVKQNGYRRRLPLILARALDSFRESSLPMAQPLRILYAEPHAADADLTLRHLAAQAPQIQIEIVGDAAAFFARLAEPPAGGGYDALLLDYRLPGMNALEVLRKLRESPGTDLPFIMITGQGDEEVAVQSLKLGATDYIVKHPGYLRKLPSILERAVHSARLARDYGAVAELKRLNELILDSAGEGILGLDLDGRHTFVNPAAQRMLGRTAAELVGRRSHPLWHRGSDGNAYPDDECPIYRACGEGVALHDQEDIFFRKDGSPFPVEYSLMPIREGRRLLGSVVTFRDISERREADERLRQTLERLRNAFDATVRVMVAAVETRDPYTAGHQSRSARLACAIAAEIGLSEEEVDAIRMAGMIHDIGKMAVPAEILSKPTKLSGVEFRLIQEHPLRGYEILSGIEFLGTVAEIVYQHHERLDGSGYPRRLSGEGILTGARILAVADVVEAMASHRPYRPALGIGAALDEIERNGGILYDGGVADACLRLFRERGYELDPG